MFKKQELQRQELQGLYIRKDYSVWLLKPNTLAFDVWLRVIQFSRFDLMNLPQCNPFLYTIPVVTVLLIFLSISDKFARLLSVPSPVLILYQPPYQCFYQSLPKRLSK
jgi:hypothetical protein